MLSNQEDEILYIDCECRAKDHVVCFEKFVWDENSTELHINMQLNRHFGFFRRIWLAIKYVFRPTAACSWGNWASTLINQTNAFKLKALIDKTYPESVNETERS